MSRHRTQEKSLTAEFNFLRVLLILIYDIESPLGLCYQSLRSRRRKTGNILRRNLVGTFSAPSALA